MEKKAINWNMLSTLGGAIGLPIGMDVLQHDDLNFDKKRIGNAILNALIGAGSGHLLHGGFAGKNGKAIVEGAGLATLAPAKDLLLNLQDTPEKLNKAVDTAATDIKLNRALTGALGLGALGLGGLGIAKYLTTKNPKTEMGSIKLKLPGKKGEPGTDAEVSLPIDLPGMSPSLMEGLNRGVRMQARKNVKANAYKRDPETGKLIPMDQWEEKYKDIINAQKDIKKAASTREWSEGAGSVLSGLLGATAGASIGSSIGSSKYRGLASIIGGILGGAAPSVLAKAVASISGDRSKDEQEAHDKDVAFKEYIIPGYADYQHIKRIEGATESSGTDEQSEDDSDNEELKANENSLSFANTLSSDASFANRVRDYDDIDYDLDKEASAPPPQPPPGVPQGPHPVDMKRTRPVSPQETPPASQESRFMSTGKASTPVSQARRASMAVRQAISKLQPKQASAYSIELYYAPEPGVKQASAIDMSAREEARGIMKKIYDEDPSYWPYGLDIPGHDSLYIVRDNMTKAAAGFVGWQEIVEGGKRIGSYSIGILPEYRNNGFAKEAVSKVLRVKSAGVDEVRAYVMKHNGPSHKLADSLGIKVQEKF